MIRKVLVVDDNEDNATSLALLLQLKGHEVRVANSGVEAVSCAAEFAPDVVLLDLSMPGQDGFTTAGELRKLTGRTPMVLVAVTGWSGDEAVRKCLEFGFTHHLTKPVDTDALDRLLSAPTAIAGSTASNA
jgi:CheY-like chemotaxis protein